MTTAHDRLGPHAGTICMRSWARLSETAAPSVTPLRPEVRIGDSSVAFAIVAPEEAAS